VLDPPSTWRAAVLHCQNQPIPRIQLHNIYNGPEVILLMLGFVYQTEVLLVRLRLKGVAVIEGHL
jgi:hypothetical protein